MKIGIQTLANKKHTLDVNDDDTVCNIVYVNYTVTPTYIL